MLRLALALLVLPAESSRLPELRLRGGLVGTDTEPSYLMPPAVGICGAGGSPYNSPVSMSSMGRWDQLRSLLDNGVGSSADGVAGEHDAKAREEAAQKLIANHVHVLKDVTHTAPSTQTNLCRVDIKLAPFVDQALRECARRLVGDRPGSSELEEKLEPSNEDQANAWRGMARFVAGRIQAMAEQHPGRQADMSQAAADAMRAVLCEIAGDDAPAAPAPSMERSTDSPHHLLSPYFTPAHFAQA